MPRYTDLGVYAPEGRDQVATAADLWQTAQTATAAVKDSDGRTDVKIETVFTDDRLVTSPQNAVTLGHATDHPDDGLILDLDTPWGVSSDGVVYWDDVGVNPGQEAVLTVEDGVIGWRRVSDLHSISGEPKPEPEPETLTIDGGTP